MSSPGVLTELNHRPHGPGQVLVLMMQQAKPPDKLNPRHLEPAHSSCLQSGPDQRQRQHRNSKSLRYAADQGLGTDALLQGARLQATGP